ncbi:MAG: hypothetical protein WC732_03800 [Candidatus Omnitrophota bacterium]
MKKSLLLGSILLALALITPDVFSKETRQIQPPKKIEYDGLLLAYNPAWKDEETYVEANLDNDPEPEIVISFVAFYKTEPEKKERETAIFVPEKQELLPVYNYVFYQIYDLGPDKKYALTKTLTGMDRPGQIQLFQPEQEKPPAIVFISPGGAHYKDVLVLRWQEGGYRHIFNQDTRGEVEVGPAGIRLGEQLYIWNARTGNLERQKDETAKDG